MTKRTNWKKLKCLVCGIENLKRWLGFDSEYNDLGYRCDCGNVIID